MAQIIGALKGDAADVFDFACHHGKKHTKDLGLILERMQHHYCGTLLSENSGIPLKTSGKSLTSLPLTS